VLLTRLFSFGLTALLLSSFASAATPIVLVTSPVDNSQVTSPVNYMASAVSPSCPQGIAAMRIYSAPTVSAFTGGGGKMDTYINLQP
jgi:hypothetical protein